MFLNALQVIVRGFLMFYRLLSKVSLCSTGYCARFINDLQDIVQGFLMFYRLLHQVT